METHVQSEVRKKSASSSSESPRLPRLPPSLVRLRRCCPACPAQPADDANRDGNASIDTAAADGPLEDTFAQLSVQHGSHRLHRGQLETRPDRPAATPALHLVEPLCNARIVAARWLTAPAATNRVLHVELDVSAAAAKAAALRPGDALALMPSNDDQLVAGIVGRLGLSEAAAADEPVGLEPAGDAALPAHLQPAAGALGALGGATECTVTVRQLLRHCVDLHCAPPKKTLLRLLADCCSAESDREALLRLSSVPAAYRAVFAAGERGWSGPHLLELLQMYGSCRPPAARLLDALPPLAPRFYSIASSPLESPAVVHVAFDVVEYRSPLADSSNVVVRRGTCTSWLERLAGSFIQATHTAEHDSESAVPIVSLKTSGAFRLPTDATLPIVMIAAGTGITPFRAFVRQRLHLLHASRHAGTATPVLGEAWLFYGCRHEQHDFLYREDMHEALNAGALTRLVTAFSRDPPTASADAAAGMEAMAAAARPKVYVQHRLL
eukprot:TRINITY_DN6131_c0_g2_i1.p1 TRINITY_DN6131_c0_g2~~TRINITY_DN6131_c0_g2_i1.p1  ORF type:complete len:551 (-),score=173.53 TRINITY_DN6131_c0_g2_i1:5-1495(-)